MSATTTDSNQIQQWQSVFRPNLFAGQIALVTGGGTGIGRSIATELALLGAVVVIASRDVDKCVEAEKEMNEEVIRRRKTDGSDSNSVGKVVVGPSTSIRDGEQVDKLVR